eukprot:TRINITY_DN24351_c0_g1_i1.p1 TRINITY_DN24351_c0_g1~~TRINITY_DN24351_c0_g1_i1.p1  ORF type:complete len:1914 (-),score=312.77 TRINITY_DN24351_c0_g1_i1:172-5913(-)
MAPRMKRLPWVFVLVGLLPTGQSDPIGTFETSINITAFKCELPLTLSDQDKLDIRIRNCAKVVAASTKLQSMHDEGVEMGAWNEWQQRSADALELCGLSNASVHSNQTHMAALYAVNAWGTYMMSGKECCNLNTPPYCVDENVSEATVLVFALLGLFLLLLVGSLIASIWRPVATANKKEERLDDSEPYEQDVAPAGYHEQQGIAQRLIQDLEAAWLGNSCLRVLPNSEVYARATAMAFASLQERFDFQVDSVRCQHEHLLSMWRSMVAVVADRKIDKCEPVDESVLLKEGLEDLWTELLEGFRVWRKKLHDCCPEVSDDLGDSSDSDDGDLPMPTLGGARWAPIAGVEDHVSRQLVEVISFLLVWGEAGNVRFMPEALYFITEQVLHADNGGSCSRMYGNAPRWTPEAGGPYRSGLFLSKVIRPIYNVVFSEWYDRVEGTGDKRDKKVLRSGFENYLPADVANYDDWDELFLDPPRLIASMILFDGKLLYDLPVGQRFAALHRLDWARSFSSTKTHREVHSLWGVFAATHRIVLLHLIMFCTGVVFMSDIGTRAFNGGQVPIAGGTLLTRMAAVGLLVPLHGLAWSFARWETTGIALRRNRSVTWSFLVLLGRVVLIGAPIVTYICLREREVNHQDDLIKYAVAHYVVSVIGFCYLLFFSSFKADELFPLTHVPLRLRIIRDLFWASVLFVKYVMSLFIFRMIFNAITALDISMLGFDTPVEAQKVVFDNMFVMHTFVWTSVWSTAFLLFVGDTQLWFCLGCSILGGLSFLVQRRCKATSFVVEDAIAKIPQRFSKKVLLYEAEGLHTVREQDIIRHTRDQLKGRAEIDDDEEANAGKTLSLSRHFPAVWDRIIQYMRYEDKIDTQLQGDMSFNADSGAQVDWQTLQQPVHAQHAANSKVVLPDIFRHKTFCEAFLQDLNPDGFGPNNADIQWRLKALSRGLGLPMPRPYRAPYIPGITVLIPHYGESILMEKSEVYNEDLNVPLIDWVKTKYEDEFRYFTSRMQARPTRVQWPAAGSHWERYTDEQWDKIDAWTSMRMQTLWRTVAGMALYYPALQCHYEVQGDKDCGLGQPGVWNAADCFSLIISMQMYHFFNKIQYEHTNKMLAKFPSCLKIAYIGCQDKNETADKDRIHSRQQRRYYSSLIDKDCPPVPGTLKLTPKLTIELPGFPILGDGKGDNQNHAIPFMRGLINQCIDANQGAYFEQMMLLPCALGEFRTRFKGDTHSKRIIGFPEHITSDIGSIGDFAASAEVAFGTLLQRTYAVLGARMHYGHPDLMSKIWMIQQGGVSKATKTLNLSEDIFAGMDFTLRGQNRKIKHCEYFNLAKGRDLGFNTVLGFFSKLSSGAGEQIITRQMFRLHQLFSLPEALTFWYAHVGYYMSQFFVSTSMPTLCFTWMLMLLSSCESVFAAFESCGDIGTSGYIPGHRAAEVMANMLGVWFSYLLLFFLVMTSLPLFIEVWMEYRFLTALTRFVKQMCTLSPLLFIFQAKTIGFYVMNELRYGGATYVSTGRGLPTERRPFIGKPSPDGFKLEKVGGLYLDYAHIAYYDGFALLLRISLILFIGGVWNAGEAGHSLFFMLFCVFLTIAAWLYAPFVFNPYQFNGKDYIQDMRAWIAFFVEEGGKHWVQWYTTNHLKPRVGFRASVIDIGFFFRCVFVSVWFTVVCAKTQVLFVIFEKVDPYNWRQIWMLCPPFLFSFALCVLGGPCVRLAGVAKRQAKAARKRIQEQFSNLVETSEDESASEDEAEETEYPEAHKALQDVVVTPSKEAKRGLCNPTPLATMSLAVIALDILEMYFSLNLFITVGWTKAVVAAVVLKFSLIDFLLWLMEGLYKSPNFNNESFIGKPISLWLYTHRMARDLIVSAFMFWTLGFFVLLNQINEACLPGCSLHMLLIYRDPGHLKRTEALMVARDEDE